MRGFSIYEQNQQNLQNSNDYKRSIIFGMSMREELINLPLFESKRVGVLRQNLGKIHKAPKKEYDSFRKYFAFSCVDLVILDGKAVLLTKRTRNPYKGYWHLPGSMIHKTETMQEAAKRSAKEELNLKIKIKKIIGVYESQWILS